MSSETKNISTQVKSSYIKLEVDDLIGYFIPYWNLAVKPFLANYNCSFEIQNYPQVNLPLDSFNINVMSSSMAEEKLLSYEEKLFTMKIHYLASEKDLNSDFFQEFKQAYNKKNLNIVMITINDIKEDLNVEKDCTRIINKIKSRIGISDIGYLPYNIIHYDKLQHAFSPFMEFFRERFTNEFSKKFENITKKFENYEKIFY